MSRLAFVLRSVMVLAVGGCYLQPVEPPPLRGPRPLDWRALVGCYQMEGLQGRPSFPFFLDSVPAKLSSGRSRDGALQAYAPGSGDPDAHWQVARGNTLELSLEGTGLGGYHYSLIVRGERLEGRLLIWSHTGRNPWYGRAAARRVPCADGRAAPASRP